MYSDNQKISMRQTFRLFFFDFLGIGTIVLPALLANLCGVYGFASIGLGAVWGCVYLWYLQICSRSIQVDLVSFLAGGGNPCFGKKFVALLLAGTHVLAAGFVGSVLAHMIRLSLIKEESYGLILCLIVLLSAYAIRQGLESRARIYEILFWFVVVPLVILIVCAGADVDLSYLGTAVTWEWSNVLTGSYLVLLTCSTLFAGLYLPGSVQIEEQGVAVKKRQTIWPCERRAFITALLVLAISYFVLIGNFGQRALGQMRYPIITLMSTIRWRGGFIRRLDAIMLAIWFFTLFSLLCMNLYYGKRLLLAMGKRKERSAMAGKHALLVVAVCAYLIGLAIGSLEQIWELFAAYFCYIHMPLYLLLPGILAVMARRKIPHKKTDKKLHGKQMKRFNKSMLSISILLFFSVYLSGCVAVELEDKSFPLLAAVSIQEDDYEIIYEPSVGNKVLDYNHIKVIVFEEDFLKKRRLYEAFLQKIMQEETFPRNSYVCVMESVDELFSQKVSMQEDIGTYIEELLENTKGIDAKKLPTIGKLIDDMFNACKSFDLPYLRVQDEQIIWDGGYPL